MDSVDSECAHEDVRDTILFCWNCERILTCLIRKILCIKGKAKKVLLRKVNFSPGAPCKNIYTIYIENI